MKPLSSIYALSRAASLIAQLVKNPPAMQEIPFNPWVGKIPWRREWLPTPVFLGFPDGSVVKNLPAIAGDVVWSLGQTDLLEKEMASHFSLFTWEIPWTEEPGGLQSIGSQRLRHC